MSRGETKDSSLFSSCNGYFLELTEWTKGSQASCGVCREDSGLGSRHTGKEGPHLTMTGGLGGFTELQRLCGFLRRYDGEFREPLVWRHGSQVSMRMARGSASLLSSHGRGIGPLDALKKDSQGLSRVAERISGFPRLVPVTSGIFSGCL